jgi:hypothetical protein
LNISTYVLLGTELRYIGSKKDVKTNLKIRTDINLVTGLENSFGSDLEEFIQDMKGTES